MSEFIEECIGIYKEAEKREAEKKERAAIKWAEQATEFFRNDFLEEPDKVKVVSSGYAHIYKDNILFITRPDTEHRYQVVFKTGALEYQKKLYGHGNYRYQLGKFLEGIYNEKD